MPTNLRKAEVDAPGALEHIVDNFQRPSPVLSVAHVKDVRIVLGEQLLKHPAVELLLESAVLEDASPEILVRGKHEDLHGEADVLHVGSGPAGRRA